MAYALPTNARVSKQATVYESAAAITPADNTQIGPYFGLYVGVSGDVTYCPINSTTTVLLKACPVGILPIAFQGVNATGTTATNLVGLA